MLDLNFYYISAKNFYCFGPEGIEIKFDSLKKIVLIYGENLDNCTNGMDEEECRNGVGKSSIPDIIVYTLYGKPIKNLKHQKVIHNKTKKDLRTEVRWGKYRVVRTRSPDTLRVWESDDHVWDDAHEKTLGGMPATEAWIAEKIGLSHAAFCNTIVFTDDPRDSFLEASGPEKRKIIENLLNLEIYYEYAEKAKLSLKEIQDLIKLEGKNYEKLVIESNAILQRIGKIKTQAEEWKVARNKEARDLVNKALAKKKELEQSDTGTALLKYQEAQASIYEKNNLILDKEKNKDYGDDVLKQVDEKVQIIKNSAEKFEKVVRQSRKEIDDHRTEILKLQKNLDKLKNNQNTTCVECFGVVKQENYENYALIAKNRIDHYEGEIHKLTCVIEKNQHEWNLENERLKKLYDLKQQATNKKAVVMEELTKLKNEIYHLQQVKEPKATNSDELLIQEIESLKQQALAKKAEADGTSPFSSILQDAEKESVDKNKELDDKKTAISILEADVPYYKFWVNAFGDKGIRQYVIDQINEPLNDSIQHWMQFLIDGKISLTFDKLLDETITRVPADGDPFVYEQMSRGEKQRLNLAVSQGFSHIRMASSGIQPSCIFLDEVSSNVDESGVQGIYNMIFELSRTRQVFVTTHDTKLLSLLENADKIHLVRKNGSTRII